MNTGKRRGGYLATTEGVKKLKEAKQQKKYTYAQIQAQIPVTLDQIKRLFNPQWGNGKYKIGEDAVSLICGVLELQPEEIVSGWHVEEIESNVDTPYNKALQKIAQAERDGATELDLSGMELTELPAEIGKLTQLTKLNLGIRFGETGISYNKLTSLPAEIGQLTNLLVLNLDTNSLSSLPAEIAQLTNLSVLHLDTNSLSSLPAEIAQLTNLSVLHLDTNSLSSLPAEIAQLTNLSVLHLDANSLSSLPAEIGQLTNLSVLSLNENNLSSLPPEIGQLTNLLVLSFGNNNLSSLPPEIGQLTNLSELYLDGNSLSSLPAEIGQLTNLSELYLDNNNLPIPPEILKQWNQPSTIINYYLSLQNSKKPLREVKMLLVGQGNVGKTCVKERLLRNRYSSKRRKTDKIEIESWEIEIKNNQYQINVWDFGGQEIMHSTHQFFLTKRSLYLLVLDTTLSEEGNRIEYWLKIINSFGEDSPVIIVGNKADQHPLDIDRKALQDKYPQIKDFYEVSCQDSTGFAKLSAKITEEIGDLKHIDDALPLPWYNVKQKLEDLDRDYIPFKDYESICETEGISKEDNQRVLIRLLNDLGVVLNFDDHPRLEDTHVLNPEWVTNGVYKIINDPSLIRDFQGILELKMLSRILQKSRYPQEKRMFIIDMMRKFELCFDIEADKKFLIADILPKNEPDTGNWDNTLAFEYHYPVYISSIISRFIVRMHQWISKDTYWRSGVVLANEGNRALVKADREDKKIMIRVDGNPNTKRNLLTAIRSDFDYIHSTIPGIVPEEKVPLLDYPNIPPVDYQWLLDLDSKNIRQTYVPGLTEEIDIRQLINGVATDTDRYTTKDKATYRRFKREPSSKPPEKTRD